MSSSTSCASFLRSNNMHPMDMCGRSTCSKSYLILSHSGLVKAACVCASLFSVDPFWLTRSWHFLTLNDDAASLILSFGDLIGITLVQTNRFPSKQDSSPKHISLFFYFVVVVVVHCWLFSASTGPFLYPLVCFFRSRTSITWSPATKESRAWVMEASSSRTTMVATVFKNEGFGSTKSWRLWHIECQVSFSNLA